jgi:hypothetical protein
MTRSSSPHARPGALALLAFLVAALAVSPAAARKKKLDTETAGSGLKEALSLGTTRAVDILGALDGFLKNDEVRIGVPEKLQTVEKALRVLGQDALVDEFKTSMNRAAEAAVPVAKEVFLDAVKQMTFEDALGILRGGEHSATEYLDAKSRPRLKELFRPMVEEKLDAVGATAAFDRFVGQYASLPFREKPLFDLPDYVTDKALDGLFLMVAKEEENIRKNVVARTTDLLKEVFGSAEAQGGEGGKTPWWKKL